MLRWQDVDFGKGFLTVRCRDDFRTKSGHDRSVPIVRDARALLETLHARWRGELAGDGALIVPLEAYVLRGERGGKLDASFLSHRFKKAIVDAELPRELHFHSLRHTCASWLAMKGVDMYTIAVILGHASGVQTTQRYAHLAPDALKAAMEGAFGG